MLVNRLAGLQIIVTLLSVAMVKVAGNGQT